MPLAAIDPTTAAQLAAIGLPGGPHVKPIQAQQYTPAPDAATNAMNLSAQLGANPATNGSQTPPQQGVPAAQAASQQDTAAIYAADPMGSAGGQGGAPAGQAQRLQAAQSAMQPTAGQQAQMDAQTTPDSMPVPASATPTAEQAKAATPGLGSLIGSVLPATGQSDAARRLAAAQAASPPPATPAPAAPPQGAPLNSAPLQPGGPPVTRDANGLPVGQAAPAPATPPATAPGGPLGAPQAAPATTPAATPQEAPQTAPAPVAAPKGPVTPEAIANAIYGQESGYGANTKTSPTGATGGMQIQPATWKQYAQPGEDINNPTDNRNVGNRIVADLYQKAGGDPARVAVGYYSGPGNIAPPGSPTPWIHDISGAAAHGGPPVSQYVAQVMGRLGQPAPAGSSLGANSPPGHYSGIDAIHDGASIGIDPKAMMSLAQSLGYKPIDTDSFNNRNLMAMGMAMMGGRTFADSMKNGAGVMNDSNNAMLGVQEKQNSNALQMAQVGINAKRADAQMALESRRADALDRDRPLGGPTLQADGTYAITMQTPSTGATHLVPVGSPAATGAQYLKDNLKQQQELQQEGETGAKNMANFNTLQKLTMDPSTAAGPGIVNEAKRAIGMALPGSGIGANASGVQLAQMLTKEFQSDAAGTMRGLGLRNQREFDTFVGQAAKIDTDPAAAAAMAKPMLERSKADYQAWQDWQAQDPAMMSQRLHSLNGVNSFRQPYDLKASQTNLAASQESPTGLAKGARDTGTAAATQAQSAGGYTAPNGISIKFSP